MFYWSPARLAYGKQLFASNPFTPSSVQDLAMCSLLTTDANQAAQWAQQAVTQALSVALTDDQSGEDNYRWNPWVLPATIWTWPTFTPQQQQTFLTNWLGTTASPGWVRFFMTWGWALTDPTSNYFFACTAHEHQASVLGTLAGVNVTDILTDWQQTRWQNQFLPQMGAIKGAFPEGSDYFREITDFLVGWLDNPAAWGPTGAQWWQDVVTTMAYWLTPAPMNRPGGGTLLQVFGLGDDEHDSDATRNNAVVNALLCFQELCAGTPAAGYASALVNRFGGAGAADYVYWLGVQPVAAGDLTTLPADRDTGPWFFMTQTNPGDPNATRIKIVADVAGGYGHNHADVGSFQALKGANWLVKEWTEYAATAMDNTGSGWAEAHCLDSLWNTRNPGPYGGSDCENKGYGPLGFGVYFRRGSTVRVYQSSTATASALGLQLTNHWRTDGDHATIDRTWVQDHFREYVYLRDLDILLVATRFTTDGSQQLVRHQVGGEYRPALLPSGYWQLNGNAVLKTLWPSTANSLVTGNPAVDFGAVLSGLSAGHYTPALTQMTANNWRLDICSTDLCQLNAYCFSGPPDTLTVTSDWHVTVTKGTVHHGVHFAAPGQPPTMPSLS